MILGVLLMMVPLGTGARILAILPTPAKSHYVVMEPLLQALAARGHQVTVYSSFPQKTSLENFTDVVCSDGTSLPLNNLDYKEVNMWTYNIFKSIYNVLDKSVNKCESVFKMLKVEEIISKQFDLVIAEMFANDCYVHFAYKLGVPLVSIVTMFPLPWTPERFGLPDNPAYIPNCLTNLQPKMDLYHRIINTLVLIYAKAAYHFYSSPKSQKIAEEYFKERLPWVEEIARSSSLLLVNSHFSLSQGRPLPPNVVDIGGIHIKQKTQLPMDFLDILDKSSQGVILLSFGSMLRVSTIPKEKINIILRVFSKLSQTVLMKYEEDLPDAPKNVITRKWLPQRDILEHKNVVALVSHCGLASIMEAVHFAKPVIGVPVFSDQFLNINTLVWKNAGVSVDLESMTEEHFQNAVDQVLNNATILQGMKTLSQQFRDRPMPALQSAVYWTEYVLRHKGAPHLRPTSTPLPFYQLWLLDVIAVLLVSIAVIIYAMYFSAKFIILKLTFVLQRSDKLKKTN